MHLPKYLQYYVMIYDVRYVHTRAYCGNKERKIETSSWKSWMLPQQMNPSQKRKLRKTPNSQVPNKAQAKEGDHSILTH